MREVTYRGVKIRMPGGPPRKPTELEKHLKANNMILVVDPKMYKKLTKGETK